MSRQCAGCYVFCDSSYLHSIDCGHAYCVNCLVFFIEKQDEKCPHCAAPLSGIEKTNLGFVLEDMKTSLTCSHCMSTQAAKSSSWWCQLCEDVVCLRCVNGGSHDPAHPMQPWRFSEAVRMLVTQVAAEREAINSWLEAEKKKKDAWVALIKKELMVAIITEISNRVDYWLSQYGPKEFDEDIAVKVKKHQNECDQKMKLLVDCFGQEFLSSVCNSDAGPLKQLGGQLSPSGHRALLNSVFPGYESGFETDSKLVTKLASPINPMKEDSLVPSEILTDDDKLNVVKGLAVYWIQPQTSPDLWGIFQLKHIYNEAIAKMDSVPSDYKYRPLNQDSMVTAGADNLQSSQFSATTNAQRLSHFGVRLGSFAQYNQQEPSDSTHSDQQSPVRHLSSKRTWFESSCSDNDQTGNSQIASDSRNYNSNFEEKDFNNDYLMVGKRPSRFSSVENSFVIPESKTTISSCFDSALMEAGVPMSFESGPAKVRAQQFTSSLSGDDFLSMPDCQTSPFLPFCNEAEVDAGLVETGVPMSFESGPAKVRAETFTSSRNANKYSFRSSKQSSQYQQSSRSNKQSNGWQKGAPSRRGTGGRTGTSLSHQPPVPEKSVGSTLLQKLGWKPGEGLGKNNEGVITPVQVEIKSDRKGLHSNEEAHLFPAKKKINYGPKNKILDLNNKHPTCQLTELCQFYRLGSPSFVIVPSKKDGDEDTYLYKVILEGRSYLPSEPSFSKKDAKVEASKVTVQALLKRFKSVITQ